MKITCFLILHLVSFCVTMANSYRPPGPSKTEQVGVTNTNQLPSLNLDRRERQQDILNGVRNTSHLRLLGQHQTTKSPPVLDDIPILPQAPNESRRPGTTNNGGIVNQVVAVASGISSGLFGVLGVNTGPNVIGFLNYRTSPRPSSIGIGNNNLPDSNVGLGDLSIGENKTKSPTGHQNIFLSLNFPQPAPILDIVGEIFGHGQGQGSPAASESCTDIRRLLGQCS